jgi:hypothetical protein
MRLYARATKKDEVSVVNRTARNFAIKAMMFTKVAEPAAIESDLKSLERKTFVKLVFARLKKKDTKGRAMLKLSTSGNRDSNGKYIKGSVSSREAMALTMVRFIKHRKSTSGYIKRGWHKVAKAFGASYESMRGTYSAVKKSSGKKATEAKLEAVFENAAKGAGDAGIKAVQQALDATVSDMRDYALRLMQETAKKYSAKRK